jgi:hypothetical protein
MSINIFREAIGGPYIVIYFPVASIAYLKKTGTEPLEFFSINFPLLQANFALGFLLLFAGALVTHSMMRAIFGHEGPRENPKRPATVIYQQFALMFSKTPGTRPKSLEGWGKWADQKDEYISENGLYSLYILLRGTSLFGLRFFYFLTTVTTTYLLYLRFASEVDYIAVGLLAGQLMYLMGAIITRRFPSVVKPESAEWIYTPEYEKSKLLYEGDEIEFREEKPRTLQELSDTAKEITNEAHADAEEYSLSKIPPNQEPDQLLPSIDGSRAGSIKTDEEQ